MPTAAATGSASSRVAPDFATSACVDDLPESLLDAAGRLAARPISRIPVSRIYFLI